MRCESSACARRERDVEELALGKQPSGAIARVMTQKERHEQKVLHLLSGLVFSQLRALAAASPSRSNPATTEAVSRTAHDCPSRAPGRRRAASCRLRR